MKVCWLSNYYSPYKIKLFTEVANKIDLTAIFVGENDGNRNEEWSLKNDLNFKVVILDQNYKKIIKQLAKENDVLIDSMYSTKYGIFAVNEFKKNHKKVIMHADGGVPIDRGFIVNKIISIVMKRHDYYLSSGPHCDEYFKFYNIDLSKVSHYHFSSLFKKDLEEHEKMISKKQEYRKELGIDDKLTILSVGRPIKLKGFDILLNAYIKSNLTDKINLYIVGGKPQEEIQKIVDDNNLKNVHFIDLLSTEELNKYYVSADFFMLCTKTDVWGLVLLEAMSFGLPVITSNNCGAGVHFNRLGENCRINGINDVDGYSKDIVDLYNHSEKIKELSKISLQNMKDYYIENGAEDIISLLNRI